MRKVFSKDPMLVTLIATFILVAVIVSTAYLTLYERRLVNTETESFIKEWKIFDKKVDSNLQVLKELNIDNSINIKYMDPGDTIEFVNHKTGLLFVGTPDSEEARIAIEVLVSTCIDEKVSNIFYIDPTRYQTDFAVNDSGLVKYVYDDNYPLLLDALDSYLGLETYKTTIQGTEYDTGEKRICIPNVFAIKNGEIVGNYAGVGKVENINNINGLTEKELNILRANYKELILLTRNHNV